MPGGRKALLFIGLGWIALLNTLAAALSRSAIAETCPGVATSPRSATKSRPSVAGA
jgi:hypothetical protein